MLGLIAVCGIAFIAYGLEVVCASVDVKRSTSAPTVSHRAAMVRSADDEVGMGVTRAAPSSVRVVVSSRPSGLCRSSGSR